MKKLIVALMIFLFLNFSFNLAYASFLTSAISKLQPAVAVAGAAGSKIIPAVFTGTAVGGNVSSWISLAIPGGAVAKVAGAVLGVAGALTIDYIFNNAPGWFVTKHLAQLGAGIVDTTSITYPVGKGFADYNYVNGIYDARGMSANYTQAQARANVAKATICNYYTNTVQYCPVASFDNTKVGCVEAFGMCQDGSTQHVQFFYPAAVPQGSPVPGNFPMTPAQVQALLTIDLAANNADAVKVGQAALEVSAAALENPSHPVNMQAAIKAAMAAALMEGVTADQKTALEGQAAVPGAIPVPVSNQDPTTYLTPAQIAAAVQAALAGQGLSAAQIAAAITAAQAGSGSAGLTQAQTQAAVAAALAGQNLTAAQIAAAVAATFPALGAYAPPAVAAAYAVPTVGNFSLLFSNFLATMRATPLFSLPGLLASSVPSGGDCTMSIDLSSRFGGSKEFSMCNWETGLSAMKAVLLCIASILAVGIVVKGGGA